MSRYELPVLQRLVGVEDEAPRLVGGSADDLRVHEVSYSNTERSERRRDADVVHEHPELHFLTAHIEKEPDEESGGSTVACQSCVADDAPVPRARIEADGQEHLDDMLRGTEIITWLIEETMSQPRTQDHSDEAIEKERVEPLCVHFLFVAYFRVDTLVGIQLTHDEIGAKKADYPAEGIPTHAERANMKSLNRGLPVDEKEHYFEL